MESVESYAFANCLLGKLPPAEWGSMRTHMEKTFILPKQILYQAGRVDEYVYFPVTAVLSMMVSTLWNHAGRHLHPIRAAPCADAASATSMTMALSGKC